MSSSAIISYNNYELSSRLLDFGLKRRPRATKTSKNRFDSVPKADISLTKNSINTRRYFLLIVRFLFCGDFCLVFFFFPAFLLMCKCCAQQREDMGNQGSQLVSYTTFDAFSVPSSCLIIVG